MISLQYSKSIPKTFVFQKQDTQQATFVEGQVTHQEPIVDISDLLLIHCPPAQFRVCIYDPQANQFVELHEIDAQSGLIPGYFLEPSIILIRFQKKAEKTDSESRDQTIEQDSRGKREIRSKQRTVRQAIALVKRWRQLSQSPKKFAASSKRMNLQQAAREMAISKKSLDDYYCQLRLAELHNFNFIQNMDEKMGKLRNFVKEHRTDEAVRIRHHKHPRNLKVIEAFVVDQRMEDYILHQRKLGNDERMSEECSVAEISLENPFLHEFSSHRIFENLEDDYYKGFQFLLDEPSDPFLCGGNNFLKKNFEEDSELSLFF